MTIKEKLEQLKKEYEEYKDKIDTILFNTNCAMSSMDSAFKEFKKTNEQIQESLTHLEYKINQLEKETKPTLDKLKKSFLFKWLV